jgi:hypothetical protein
MASMGSSQASVYRTSDGSTRVVVAAGRRLACPRHRTGKPIAIGSTRIRLTFAIYSPMVLAAAQTVSRAVFDSGPAFNNFWRTATLEA